MHKQRETVAKINHINGQKNKRRTQYRTKTPYKMALTPTKTDEVLGTITLSSSIPIQAAKKKKK